MSELSNTSASLAEHLSNLIVSRSDNSWLRVLSLESDIGKTNEPHHVALATDISIHPTNMCMAASRFARALLPALFSHSLNADRRVSSLVIRTAEERGKDRGTLIIDQALGFDVGKLHDKIVSGLRQYGLNETQASFYNIKLGTTNFRIVTVHGTFRACDRQEVALWREQINQEFDVNIRFSEQRAKVTSLTPSHMSDISITNLKALQERYSHTRNANPIQSTALRNLEDWRDLRCLSIDSAATCRPEDIIHLSRNSENNIILRSAIPFSTASNCFFSPYQDLVCIGVSQEFDLTGGIVASSVTPVIAHNSFPLDSHSVSCAATDDLSKSASLLGERVRSIRANQQLSEQIDIFYDLADRVVSHGVKAGAATSFRLSQSERSATGGQQAISSDYLLGRISALTQHTIANWALAQEGAPSLIGLRSHLAGTPTFERLKQIFPRLNERDLLDPEKLDSIATQLEAAGNDPLKTALADLLESMCKRNRLHLISQADEIVPSDRIRIKSIRSAIGEINNLQLQSVMAGQLPISPHLLSAVIDTIRKDSASTEGAARRRQIAAELSQIRTNLKIRISG